MSDNAQSADELEQRETDLLAETWCPDCESLAALDETDIDEDTGWLSAECDCGKVEMGVRVAPWPRDGMERIDGEWDWPDIANHEHPDGEGGDALVTE